MPRKLLSSRCFYNEGVQDRKEDGQVVGQVYAINGRAKHRRLRCLCRAAPVDLVLILVVENTNRVRTPGREIQPCIVRSHD